MELKKENNREKKSDANVDNEGGGLSTRNDVAQLPRRYLEAPAVTRKLGDDALLSDLLLRHRWLFRVSNYEILLVQLCLN